MTEIALSIASRDQSWTLPAESVWAPDRWSLRWWLVRDADRSFVGEQFFDDESDGQTSVFYVPAVCPGAYILRGSPTFFHTQCAPGFRCVGVAQDLTMPHVVQASFS